MRAPSALLILFLLTACGGSGNSTAPATQASIVGVWDATAVNGAALPADVNGAYFTVLTEELTVRSDGTYGKVQTWNQRRPDGSFTATQTDNETGRWATSGLDYSFRIDSESPQTPASTANISSANLLYLNWTYNVGTSYSTNSFLYKRH